MELGHWPSMPVGVAVVIGVLLLVMVSIFFFKVNLLDTCLGIAFQFYLGYLVFSSYRLVFHIKDFESF